MSYNKIIDLKQLATVSGLDVTPDELVALIVEQYTMSTQEIIERFECSKQRVNVMKEQKLISEVKKGLYLLHDVNKMREMQIREKRLEKFNGYKLMPAYEVYEGSMIIDRLRFFDCLTMVRVDSENADYEPSNDEYNVHLAEVLTAVKTAFELQRKVYMLEHRGFQYVTKEEDIQEVFQSPWFGRTFSKTEFLEFLLSPASEILGMRKIINFIEITESLSKP